MMKLAPTRTARAIAVLLGLLGCSGPSVNYTPLSPNAAGGRPRTPDVVVVFMRDSPPTKNRRVFARVETVVDESTVWPPLTESSSIALLKAEAARRGADGIEDLYCGAFGTKGSGQCTASLFVYSPP
jgi:hypothetical protein